MASSNNHHQGMDFAITITYHVTYPIILKNNIQSQYMYTKHYKCNKLVIAYIQGNNNEDYQTITH